MKLTHEKTRRVVDVPQDRVDYYTGHGWTAGEPVEEVQGEIVLPDPAKANHEAIDAFAAHHSVTFEGIEAEDAEKPTKAEKVAHLQKVITERDSA